MKIGIKFIAVFLCFIMFAAAFSSCDLIYFDLMPADTTADTETDAAEPADTAEETESDTEEVPEKTVYEFPTEVDESDTEVYGTRNVLSREEKMYYDVFETELPAYAMKVTFKTNDRKGVARAYDAFTRDHPECFWLIRAYDCTVEKRHGENYIEFVPYVLLTVDEIKTNEERLKIKLDKILKDVPEGLTEYETALYFHDLIVENTSYDLDALAYIETGTRYTKFLYESTAFGCLVNGRAVCSGYSAAYQLLLQSSGIMSGRVASNTHEWNYVRLDGEYYFVDSTWDDPVADDGTSDSLLHKYFMFTTYELLMDDEHNPSYAEIFVPKATATDYNYYAQIGQYIDTYSFEAVKKIITEHYYDGEVIEIKFSTEAERQRATEDLITVSGRAFEIYLPNGEACFPDSVKYISSGLYLSIYT